MYATVTNQLSRDQGPAINEKAEVLKNARGRKLERKPSSTAPNGDIFVIGDMKTKVTGVPQQLYQGVVPPRAS